MQKNVQKEITIVGVVTVLIALSVVVGKQLGFSPLSGTQFKGTLTTSAGASGSATQCTILGGNCGANVSCCPGTVCSPTNVCITAPTGACCTEGSPNSCSEMVLQSACAAANQGWHQDMDCAQAKPTDQKCAIPCPNTNRCMLSAVCDPNTGGGCYVTANCTAINSNNCCCPVIVPPPPPPNCSDIVNNNGTFTGDSDSWKKPYPPLVPPAVPAPGPRADEDAAVLDEAKKKCENTAFQPCEDSKCTQTVQCDVTGTPVYVWINDHGTYKFAPSEQEQNPTPILTSPRPSGFTQTAWGRAVRASFKRTTKCTAP